MIYFEHLPTRDLQPWIRSLWYCSAPHVAHRRERVLPNGCMQIVMSLSRPHLTDCGEDGTITRRLPRAIVVGVRARFEVIDTTDMEELVGVAFHPGGFARLFRERADLFFEQSVGLDDIGVAPQIADRLCEAATPAQKLSALGQRLTGLIKRDIRRSELVDHAIHLFRSRALTVSQCARSLGLSERRLSQVFREEVGMAPKTWCRIGRFQAAVRALHCGVDVPWAELALRCGYYDQSHFANDFRAFSGIDPTTYSAQRGRWQNHVAIS
jgi:AraC-like DNA-binding protein